MSINSYRPKMVSQVKPHLYKSGGQWQVLYHRPSAERSLKLHRQILLLQRHARKLEGASK